MQMLRFFVVLMTVYMFSIGIGYAQQNTGPISFTVDPSWPKPLPNQWILGQVSGVAVDANDHIWVLQRPRSLTEEESGAAMKPPISICCRAAPAVMEFDTEGNLIQAWGGPGKGYTWPSKEHSIWADKKGFIWITGSGEKDGQILKFSNTGKFILQIGKAGSQTNNNDVTRLGQLAGITVDDAANEVYVADGYHNRRVIVFDATTGAYKRHWGAYGKHPLNTYPVEPFPRRQPPPKIPSAIFGTPVHCVHISQDNLVYVCDRSNNRLQVFNKNGSYVKEFIIEPNTAGFGSTWDLTFSLDPQQQFIYLIDGANNQLLTLERDSGEIVARQGRQGRYAGQFHWPHDIAMDSKGNIYIGEVDTGKRIQKFLPTQN